jgi:hypothetical protein
MDKITNELGIIVVILIAAVILDSWYLQRVYHYSPVADPLGLLRDVPDYLSRNKTMETKFNILRIIGWVFLQTMPLVISAYWMTRLYWSDQLKGAVPLVCLAIPFGVYYAIFDRKVLFDTMNRFGQKFDLANGYNIILGYYFSNYQFPLTLTACVLGGWAGTRFRPR